MMPFEKKRTLAEQAQLQRSIVASTMQTMRIEGRLPDRAPPVDLGTSGRSALVQSIKAHRRVV